MALLVRIGWRKLMRHVDLVTIFHQNRSGLCTFVDSNFYIRFLDLSAMKVIIHLQKYLPIFPLYDCDCLSAPGMKPTAFSFYSSARRDEVRAI